MDMNMRLSCEQFCKSTLASIPGFRHARFVAFAALSVALSGIAGCGGSPGMAQVSGTVLYKDGSVPKGGVCGLQFVPAPTSTAEVRKGAGGDIGPDGKFTLFTRKPGDGVFVGDYDVTFTVWPSISDNRSLIEEKYTQQTTTPYHVKVEGDVSDLKFELEPKATKK